MFAIKRIKSKNVWTFGTSAWKRGTLKNVPFESQREPGPAGQDVQLVEPKTSGDFKKSTRYVMKLIKIPGIAEYVQAGQGVQFVGPTLRYSLDQIREVSTRTSV